MTKIDYRPSLPDAVRDAVDRHLPELLHLLPTWVHTVLVHWVDEAKYPASIDMDYTYRRIDINIGPCFLNFPEDQYGYLVHEIAHASAAPMVQFVDEQLLPVVADESLRNALKEEWRVRVESSNCDLTRTFLSLTGDVAPNALPDAGKHVE